MKIVFFILWCISVIVWLVYTIRLTIALKRNEDYLEENIKMLMATISVLICNMFIQILK